VAAVEQELPLHVPAAYMDNVGVNCETCTLTFVMVWPDATCTVCALDDWFTIVTVAELDETPSYWLVAVMVTWLGEGTLAGAL
jgi:hypothetical protein